MAQSTTTRSLLDGEQPVQRCCAPRRARRRRPLRFRRVVGAAVVAVLLWDGSALAINALVSQDLPLLAQIAATEAAAYAELGALLAQASAIVAHVKEYTTVAKTAWGALDELRHMTPDQLRDAALLGVRRAFPELGDMYGHIRDIRDLDYRDHRAVATLRGIIWDEVYGPAIDYLHAGHGTLDALAVMQEHQLRHAAKAHARRQQATRWAEDCARTAARGEGACQAAANRATVQHALALADIQETNLHILDAQQRVLKRAERDDADRVYAFERWLHDLEAYMLASTGDESLCPAGQCLYEQYGTRMQGRLMAFRAQHPEAYARSSQ
jgi:hypothetical protein